MTGECVDLVFEGLDTFATVKLNGEEILKYARMTLGELHFESNYLYQRRQHVP